MTVCKRAHVIGHAWLTTGRSVSGDTPLDEAALRKVEELVQSKGVFLEGIDNASAQDGLSGWEGGVVWLVPTDKPVTDWKPIATRTIGS